MNFAEKYNSIVVFIEENLHRKTDEISQIKLTQKIGSQLVYEDGIGESYIILRD